MSEPKIRIHNMGIKRGDKFVARKIQFPIGWDADGHPMRSPDGKKVLDDVLLPNQHKSVTMAQFKHLKSQFGDEIINIDDISELQRQFDDNQAKSEKKADTGDDKAPPAGFVSKADAQEMVDRAVAVALAKARDAKPEAKAEEGAGEASKSNGSRESLILELDAMDKSELIAYVEQKGLDIDCKKFKKDELKAAILTALENKAAAGGTLEDNSGANNEEAA